MDDHGIDTRRGSGARAPLRRVVALLVARPVASVVAVALLMRLAVALGPYLVHHGYVIPDEREYVDLGTAMMHGRTPEQWFPGYGNIFYDSTRAFMAPLVLLFHAFGATRLTDASEVAVGSVPAGTVPTS